MLNLDYSISRLKTPAWSLLIGIVSAQVLPVLETLRSVDARNENNRASTGEPPSDRTIITLLSLFCMAVLSSLIGSRFVRLRKYGFSKRNITSILVIVLNSIVMTFVVCSAVMVAGQGLHTHALCVGGTWICLIFYTLAKGIIYIFFVERIHVVRAPFFPRSQDVVYLSCMVAVLLALVGQSINAYIHPVTEMREFDGRCHFGIPGKVSIPGLAIDLIGGMGLTGLLFYLLRPVIKVQSSELSPGVPRPNLIRDITMTQDPRNETAVQRNIRILLWKSVVGSILIVVPTTANMIQFVITEGQELGMVCLSICMLDLTWDAVIIHWLTFGSSAEAEKLLIHSNQVSMSNTLVMRSASTNNDRDGELGAIPTGHRLLKESPNVPTTTASVEDTSGDHMAEMALPGPLKDHEKEGAMVGSIALIDQ